ncbi:hypothetical protein PMAYCL1PPCAC_14280, partial [Pristionchus mayeri]
TAYAEVEDAPDWIKPRLIKNRKWNPYSMEGGSTVAIAGDDFVVIGSDTRLSADDIKVINREVDKIHALSDRIVITSSGFFGDILHLRKLLESHLQKYRFQYRSNMTVDLCAELLARQLYFKRFYPYYTGAILAGIDEHGKGAVFSYDPIGCIEQLPYSASGAAKPLITPFLDCQVGHVTLSEGSERPKLTIERACALMRDAFRACAEREITTGDSIHLVIAEAGKPPRQERRKLRED